MTISARWIWLLAAMWMLLMSGCVSTPLINARNAFYQQQPDQALAALDSDQEISVRDRLLLHMEKGLIYHQLGRYGESARELRNASDLMEQQETISVSQQTVSIVTSDWVTEYKGEYAERLWVHTYLMMDYLLLYDYESALVEAKQALKVMESYPEALADAYFTRALIALCYDNLQEWNDAYIEYKKLAEQLHDDRPVLEDLHRLARQLGFIKEAQQYQSRLSANHWKRTGTGASQAELVLFVGAGKGPVKVPENIVLPPSIRFSFPRYQERSSVNPSIQVWSEAGPVRQIRLIATDLNQVAKASLHHRYLQVLAKETARATAKEAIAQSVGRKNDELVETLVRLVLFVTEEPDTRCWETLPAYLGLVRIQVPAGIHTFSVRISGPTGHEIGQQVFRNVRIGPGQRRYFSLRVPG